MAAPTMGVSLIFERALRLSASGHRDQVRKGTGVPYIEHPFAVAMILDRAGFDEEIVIAGLLHDLVEDTRVTLDQIRHGFGSRIGSIVGSCSEEKLDIDGKKRPWIDRKQDHLAAARIASDDVHAVILADKLHNLLSVKLDLADGVPVWEKFNANKDQILWYHAAMIEACRSEDTRLIALSNECQSILDEVVAL